MFFIIFVFEVFEKFLDKLESVFVVSVDVFWVFFVNLRIVGYICWFFVNIFK